MTFFLSHHLTHQPTILLPSILHLLPCLYPLHFLSSFLTLADFWSGKVGIMEIGSGKVFLEISFHALHYFLLCPCFGRTPLLHGVLFFCLISMLEWLVLFCCICMQDAKLCRTHLCMSLKIELVDIYVALLWTYAHVHVHLCFSQTQAHHEGDRVHHLERSSRSGDS